MGALNFHALAENTKRVSVPNLMSQARAALSPFQQFLKQAVKTAAQRQTKYHLPWQRVKEKFLIQPEPLDTVLRIKKPVTGWVVEGWPATKEPDITRPLTNQNTDEQVHAMRVERSSEGCVVYLNAPVIPGDEFTWCRESVRLRPQGAPAKPRTLRLTTGMEVGIRGKVESHGESHWRVVVEGIHRVESIVADGNELDCLVPSEEVRSLEGSGGKALDAGGSWPIWVDELPEDEVLTADNGVRYRWSQKGGQNRQAGLWIELLPPDKEDGDALLDPRAMFCEDRVEEVWTAPKRFQATVIKVKRVDRERYRLAVAELPPAGTELYLPLDVRNLHLQGRAIRQLKEEPLPHHRGLLRLTEEPMTALWPVRPRVTVSKWYFLTDETRDGTIEQREFVLKALSTPDFAFLEGPPGSGKTTAICEIISQLIEQGKRILLCASTHVAVDNVIERMVSDPKTPVYPVRIGKVDKVDEAVRQCQIDHRIEAVKLSLLNSPDFAGVGDGDLEDCAERLVLMSANLTCGTTMGIVGHPLFREQDSDLKAWERPITKMPHWDVLIVDEASKTLVQEFMVPALMAPRWIVVGDVKQLPPFADRADLVASLRCLIDDREQPVFPEEHQMACLLYHRLNRREVVNSGTKWLVVAPSAVHNYLEAEISARAKGDQRTPVLGRFVAAPREGYPGDVAFDAVDDSPASLLRLWAADWVLVPADFWSRAAAVMPPGFLLAVAPERGELALPPGHPFHFRHTWSMAVLGDLRPGYRDRKDSVADHATAQRHEAQWLKDYDWAGEVAWRLTRHHELRRSSKSSEQKRLLDDIAALSPCTVDISSQVGEIYDISLPSVLESVQEGVGAERSSRPSALTKGMRSTNEGAFLDRFTGLSFQHRMHPDISAMPRELFYNNESLRDANTIASRDSRGNWSWTPYPARRVWANVSGSESRGENLDEVNYIESQLKDFLKWAESAGRPKGCTTRFWEVACLTCYVKQEGALSAMLQTLSSAMLQTLSGEQRKTRFSIPHAHTEIVCGTVDRFQGREADLVFLSLRNTARVGFLDSPNRLNVAITRARQQLVIVGKADYFSACRTAELEELAKNTRRIDGNLRPTGRRR